MKHLTNFDFAQYSRARRKQHRRREGWNDSTRLWTPFIFTSKREVSECVRWAHTAENKRAKKSRQKKAQQQTAERRKCELKEKWNEQHTNWSGEWLSAIFNASVLIYLSRFSPSSLNIMLSYFPILHLCSLLSRLNLKSHETMRNLRRHKQQEANLSFPAERSRQQVSSHRRPSHKIQLGYADRCRVNIYPTRLHRQSE